MADRKKISIRLDEQEFEELEKIIDMSEEKTKNDFFKKIILKKEIKLKDKVLVNIIRSEMELGRIKILEEIKKNQNSEEINLEFKKFLEDFLESFEEDNFINLKKIRELKPIAEKILGENNEIFSKFE